MSSSKTNRAVAQVIIVLVVVAGAAFLINSNVAGVQVYNVYPTISMLPTLEVGDLVIVHSVPFSSIKIGDVIVYEKTNPDGGCTAASEVIVHRVVNMTSTGLLITQGDDRLTNPYPDEGPPINGWPPIPASCVKGVVVLAVPYLGRITEAFPPPYNYALVVAILALVFLLEVRPGGSKKKADPAEPGATDGSTPASASPPRASSSVLYTVWIVISNVVILALIFEVLQDYAYRLSYWRSMGFTPSQSFSLFSFVTTATKGSTYIGGLLTLDWTQVLVVILVVIDASYVLGLVRRRSSAEVAAPEALTAGLDPTQQPATPVG